MAVFAWTSLLPISIGLFFILWSVPRPLWWLVSPTTPNVRATATEPDGLRAAGSNSSSRSNWGPQLDPGTLASHRRIPHLGLLH